VALTWNRCLPPGQVRAQVESGWLTLSGQVLRDAQRQDAEDCLRDLPGLAGVTNRITIKPKAPAPSIKRVP
jgi:osmotically-inducible protein OsmY